MKKKGAGGSGKKLCGLKTALEVYYVLHKNTKEVRKTPFCFDMLVLAQKQLPTPLVSVLAFGSAPSNLRNSPIIR